MYPPPRRSSGPSLLSWPLILGALGVALALPLLGGWVASTLVVHHGASWEWGLAVGVGLGLGIPLFWEVLSLPRRQARGAPPRRWLRLRTRMLLRTWAVNLVFLGGALLLSPRGVFTALSTQGDWMLPPEGSPHVESIRRLLFAAADRVEWAYLLATDHPYRDQLIATAPRPSPPREQPRPASSEPGPKTEVPPPTASAEKDPLSESDADVVISWKSEPHPSEPTSADTSSKPTVIARVDMPTAWRDARELPSGPRRAGDALSYPLMAQLDPRVASVPREVEKDLVSVAKYLVAGEGDSFRRIKALHDYVADRVEYDMPAYLSRKMPPQDPEAVLKSRRAVCAGYANLFAAMARAVGEEVVTISGEAAGAGLRAPLEPHAWNAVRIGGDWYLVDVTWDAGGVSGELFQRNYRTTYLFMPPKDFLLDHIPDDPAWQLVDEPLDRGTAMRQARSHCQKVASALIDPQKPVTEEPTGTRGGWEGIRILEPPRPLAEVRGRFRVELDNPKGLPAEVSILNLQDGSQEPCSPEYKGTKYGCTVLNRGLYRIQVFVGPQTPPQLMAQLEVTGT